ncbi:MAG: hydratase [Oscillospiraceae bacterium]|jgi:aconitate hydratase|nr:hydratase [Oscillospiraceae bacterium]
MVEVIKKGAYLMDSQIVWADEARGAEAPDTAREKTIAYSILRAHDRSTDPAKMRIRFDALISHDITFVGIIQTARASGLEKFPVPYAMTNCHNSLCAVGGTINEDDHAFGLSAARRYGGIYVPPNQAVIHQYARERLAGCGKMILGSDSHTRYGAYGCMGIGEGGGELVKQLLENTYDVPAPEVALVYLDGRPRKGVGPQDVAIALVAAVFPSGDVKNKVLEFVGPGVKELSADYRAGIDVMTTETSCLTSIWETDGTIRDYYENIGRPGDFRELKPGNGAYYDSVVKIDLSRVECMIALPFHPSIAYTVHELQADPERIFAEVEDACNKQLGGKVAMDLRRSIVDGKVTCDQGVIVGCSGGMYENVVEAAKILEGQSIGNGYFDLSVYPSSTPISLAITRNGAAATLMEAGCVMKPAFCGPCFGAGDTPANNSLSIRHATRNFANREGSKPGDGQTAAVALMDARSIAATARNGGVLTAATDIDYGTPTPEELAYRYDGSVYAKRCYEGFGKADPSAELRYGPNIKDWPHMPKLENDLLVRLCAVIHDPVTTTDELIPSGETSSYRSNPLGLSEFALSRRAPEYVGRSKAVRALEEARERGETPAEAARVLAKVGGDAARTTIGSCVFANKPGDGSAREQAASCQKVLGGFANICYEYATKRYRSNCINWGIVPFTMDAGTEFPYEDGDWVYIPGVKAAIAGGVEDFAAKVIRKDGTVTDLPLKCAGLTADEKLILQEGCLMNYYAAGYGKD